MLLTNMRQQVIPGCRRGTECPSQDLAAQKRLRTLARLSLPKETVLHDPAQENAIKVKYSSLEVEGISLGAYNVSSVA